VGVGALWWVDNHSNHSYKMSFNRFIISESTLNRNKIVLFVGCEVRLSPLGSPPNNEPIAPAQDDGWVWSMQWNENWQGNKWLWESLPQCHLVHKSHVTSLGLKPSRRGMSRQLAVRSIARPRGPKSGSWGNEMVLSALRKFWILYSMHALAPVSPSIASLGILVRLSSRWKN
jgi:hypothetical protein